LIEAAHREGERLGLAVWNQDEAGPYQAIPQAGASWQPLGQAARQPHEYERAGTAKLLTLLHPATGQVRVQGVISSANVVLHLWLHFTCGYKSNSVRLWRPCRLPNRCWIKRSIGRSGSVGKRV